MKIILEEEQEDLPEHEQVPPGTIIVYRLKVSDRDRIVKTTEPTLGVARCDGEQLEFVNKRERMAFCFGADILAIFIPEEGDK